MLFEVVSAIQTISDSFDFDFGFAGWLLSPIVNNVPDWLVVIILGALWCVLLIGLRNYCKVRSLVKSPLITLTCLVVGIFFFDLIACFIDEESIAVLVLSLAISVLIAMSIVAFIVGIKFTNSQNTRKLGIRFILYAVLPIISCIVEAGLLGGKTEFTITELVETFIAVDLFYELHEVLKTE